MEELEMTDEQFEAEIKRIRKLVWDAIPARFNQAAAGYALAEAMLALGDEDDTQWVSFCEEVICEVNAVKGMPVGAWH